MPQTPQAQWPGMVSGWLVPLMWPLAAGVMLAVLMRGTSELDLLDIAIWGSLGLILFIIVELSAEPPP